MLLLLCSCAEALPSYLKRNMNLSANPCEDFYAFACGGWPQAHEGGNYSSQVEQLDHMYHDQLSALLEQQAPATEPRFVQLLRNSYDACLELRVNYEPAQFVRMLRESMSHDIMNIDQEGGMTPLLRLLLKFGRLNYFKWREEDDNNVELTETEQWLQRLQLFWPHFDKDSEEWQANKTDRLPLTHEQFGHLYRALQPLGVPEEALWQQVKQLEQLLWNEAQYEEETETEEQKELEKEQQHSEEMEDSLEVFEEQQIDQVEQELEQQLELESEEHEDEESPLVTLYLEWDRHAYQSWLLPVPAALPDLLRYLLNLPSVLRVLPREQLQRYLLLRLLHRLQLMPPPNLSPLECAAQTRLLLPHATDWLLEQQLSPAQRQQRRHHVQRVFVQLRQQFRQRVLANRNHFNRATQYFLLDKLRRMRLRLGLLPTGEQPPLLGAAGEQQLLEQHYAPLQLNASDYFGNLVAMFRQHQVWIEEQNVEALHDRRALILLHPLDFGTYASPFFMPAGNLLVLPPSMLAPPIYQAHQGKLYRLSSLGFLLSHEMSHSLAPTDVKYDGRGTLSFWPANNMLDSARYDDQLSCLLHRYQQKANEKFADMNGIDLAYKAYTATTKASWQQQQRFFINFAQFFCRAGEQEQLVMDTHGSNRERVNEAVASVEAFGYAFDCAPDEASRQCQLY